MEAVILIVADTGPVNYLVQIGCIGVLPQLAERVVLPALVRAELMHRAAPAAVRKWAESLPAWVEVRAAQQRIEAKNLSPADGEAIALARELCASLLLMDDQQARRSAAGLGVPTMGTLGLLEVAGARDLLALPEVLERLRATSCFLTDELVDAALRRDAKRRHGAQRSKK